MGGTQTAGGDPVKGSSASYNRAIPYSGGFGYGGNSSKTTAANYGGGAGGGAGWYGGAGADVEPSAGGGSSYIGNTKLLSINEDTKHMTCFGCETSDESDTLTYSTDKVSQEAISDYAKKRNGYARITTNTMSHNTFLKNITYRTDDLVEDEHGVSISETMNIENFATDTYAYTVEVPYNTQYVEIDAETYDVTTTFTGNGRHKLEMGNNPLTIIVTAEDGTVTNYTVTFVRVDIEGHSTELHRIEIENADTIDCITGITEYNISLELNQMSAAINAIPYDQDVNITVEDNTLFLIPTGTITITVTDENADPSETVYKLHYTANSDRTYEPTEFNYTGEIQSFTAPVSGYYQLETWGAQGGDASVTKAPKSV